MKKLIICSLVLFVNSFSALASTECTTEARGTEVGMNIVHSCSITLGNGTKTVHYTLSSLNKFECEAFCTTYFSNPEGTSSQNPWRELKEDPDTEFLLVLRRIMEHQEEAKKQQKLDSQVLPSTIF